MLNSVKQLQTLVTTIFRLFFRRHRLWWDDACAFLSMLFFIILIISDFIFTHEPARVSQSARIATYYVMSSAFYGAIWFARLCMLFSIIRIDPDPYQRKRLVFMAATFALAGILLAAQIYWVCVPKPTWKNLSIPQCPLDTQVVVCQLVSDVAAEFILMAASLKLFRDILDKGLRRRLILIFSACIMTGVVSLVHVIYILTNGGIKNLIVAGVEACVSLVVCSLPVFAVATIRLREEMPKRDDGLETSRISIETSETIISLNSG